MTRLYILGFCLFAISSCSSNDTMPKGILKPVKMQAVLWDIIRADVFTTDYIKKDTAKNAAAENLKLQQQIFALHQVTGKEFYNSYDYYKNHTADFKMIIDSMVAQAQRNNLIKNQTQQAE